ncbi:MAG: dipeptidase [Hungatella sp.]
MRVVDMHCDTIAELYENHKAGGSASISSNDLHLDLQKMSAGDYLLQNFALFTYLEGEDRPFEYAMKLVDTFYTELEAHQDLIGIVTSYADIEKNRHRGRMSALLSIEEGGVCQGELSFLRDFYRVGVRMMTLTWNFQNELAYPNRMTLEGPDAGVCRPETVHGLTERGIAFVEEMERLGMIVDISHLGDAGIRDVFAHTKKPLVASHSNARALAGHPRNLTDAMIRELSERGGVVGINYCAAFLRDWGAGEAEISRVSDMVLHMKHMKQIGGISCIGLGSDFDGIGGELELKSAAALPLLEVEMRKQGFTESEIEAVFYQNVLRVYREILK